jgi:hypothetical protein
LVLRCRCAFGPRFALERQAQIIRQPVTVNNANDGLGASTAAPTSGAAGRRVLAMDHGRRK